MTLDAQLLERMSAVVGRRTLTQVEDDNWRSGSATGGPNGDGTYPMTAPDGSVNHRMSPAAMEAALNLGIGLSVRTPQQHAGPLANIADAVQAVDGTWSGTDATAAIQGAIDWCRDRGGGTVFIPRGQYFIGAPGVPYLNESKVRGIIRMRRNVKIVSDGALLVLSGGRHNPPCLLSHDYTRDHDIDNVLVKGLILDNNMDNQTWDKGDASGGTTDTDFQYQHCIEWLCGDNVEICNCLIRNTRGSGIAAGDVFTPYMNFRTSRNLHIHHNEFYNCYREAAIIPWADGGSFDHNYVHGDGYLVAGVDLERHTMNERVVNFAVHDNLFDFRDGCRDADRVRAIDNLDASLAPASSAQGGDRAVPSDAAAPPAGR